MFHFNVRPEELFPYPTYSLNEEEGENLASLTGELSKEIANDKTYAGARINTEYGGLGLSSTAFSLVCEEIGRSRSESLLSALQSSTLSVSLLSAAGTKEQKGKYLTKMSDGSEVFGWAVQEGNGSDLSMNTTQSVMNDSGYVLNGSKLCKFAAQATYFLVLAKTKTQIVTEDGPQESERSSVFIVNAKANGVSVEGDHLILNNAEAEDIIGTAGEGFRNQLITTLTEQYAPAAAILGTLKACCQELSAAMRDGCYNNFFAFWTAILYAMESALYAVTANIDRQVEDILLETCFTSAFIRNMSERCITALSAVSPLSEASHKTVSTLLSMMPTTDELNAAAVTSGVEEYGLAFQATSTLSMMQKRTVRMLGIKDHIAETGVDFSKIDASIVEFGNAVESTFVRNTTSLPFQQSYINRLGEAAQLLYAAAAAGSRAAMAKRQGLATAGIEKKLAEIFIKYASERANALSNECRNTGMTPDDICKRITLELCDDVAR